jgi:hypothetical protein
MKEVIAKKRTNFAVKHSTGQEKCGGPDGTRTRDPRRDRPVF